MVKQTVLFRLKVQHTEFALTIQQLQMLKYDIERILREQNAL